MKGRFPEAKYYLSCGGKLDGEAHYFTYCGSKQEPLYKQEKLKISL